MKIDIRSLTEDQIIELLSHENIILAAPIYMSLFYLKLFYYELNKQHSQ